MNRLLRDVLPLLGMEAGYAAAHLETGPGRFLPGRLPTDELAVGSVAAAGLAAEALLNTGRIDVDPAQVRVAMLGEQVQTIDGRRSEGFGPWSGFFPTAEGWLRTHANYSHHRVALANLLGLDPDAGREELAAALCSRQPNRSRTGSSPPEASRCGFVSRPSGLRRRRVGPPRVCGW